MNILRQTIHEFRRQAIFPSHLPNTTPKPKYYSFARTVCYPTSNILLPYDSLIYFKGTLQFFCNLIFGVSKFAIFLDFEKSFHTNNLFFITIIRVVNQ